MLIYRTGWNHEARYHSYRTASRNKVDELQVSYHKIEKKISISYGNLTQFVFETNYDFKTLEELEKSFVLVRGPEDALPDLDSTLMISHNVELKFFKTSRPYLIRENNKIDSAKLYFNSGYYPTLKTTFDITVIENEINQKPQITGIKFIRRIK